jgi:hypothetical protein
MGGHIHTRQWWGAQLTKASMKIALTEDLKEILIMEDIEIIPSIVPHLTVGAMLNEYF